MMEFNWMLVLSLFLLVAILYGGYKFVVNNAPEDLKH